MRDFSRFVLGLESILAGATDSNATHSHKEASVYPCSSKYPPGAVIYSFKVRLDQRIIPGPQTSHGLSNPMQYQSHYKHIILSVKCILRLSY